MCALVTGVQTCALPISALEAEPVGQPESDGCLVSRSAVFDQRCAGGVSGEPVIACQNRARDALRKGDVGAQADAGGQQAALGVILPQAGTRALACRHAEVGMIQLVLDGAQPGPDRNPDGISC